ncbi:DUF6011 domain-containing protein [Micromonospora zamorensis]|uniref:DUF6011 domain-containing protein n=1 Tax=Micromonospora zamorensis TaxID=709883 RepID=UPI003723F620
MSDPNDCEICGRKLRTAKSRARRRGPVCDAKTRPVPAALPGLAGRGGPALQDGPDLLDEDDQP